MLWSITVLVGLSFVINTKSANITCYSDGTTDADKVDCSTYCEISSSPFDSETSYDCADEPVYCDIFGAVNKCIKASATVKSYDVECNNRVASANVTTSTGDFEIECCTTNDCNSDFTTTCSSSSSLQTYLDYFVGCYTYSDSEWYDIANYSCGASTSTYYSQSYCNIVTYSVKSTECQCEGFVYVYGLASTDAQRASLLAYTNITDYDLNETDYGCNVVSTCSLTGGFSYSITSYSFTIGFSIVGLTSVYYTPYSVGALIATSLSGAGYTTTRYQVYINSVNLASSVSETATLSVTVEYATWAEANTTQSAVASGDVTFSASGVTATITSTGSVSTTTYTSSSAGNMNMYIGISLLLSFIGLLFN